MIIPEAKKELLKLLATKFCPGLALELKKITAYENFLLHKTVTTNLRQANGGKLAQQYRDFIQNFRDLIQPHESL